MMNPVEKAVEEIGSQAEMARQLKVSYQVISLWVEKGTVPPGRAVEISDITGIDYQDLAPDFNWPC